MKSNQINFVLVIFSITLIFLSCRSEEMESIQAPEEEVLVAKSNIATLIKRTSSNDGSNDNIIDYSNCFNIKLPIALTVNGSNINVNSPDDYKIIEYLFDDSDDDIDILDITFPITIILNDFTEITIANTTELSNYSNNCNGENENDDDIECLDFQYPITASLFNSESEVIDVITINSDNAFYHFIDDLSTNDFVTINFPIIVTLFDNTTLTINDFVELESTIETYSNSCDEDDDYDYNDDDCNDCNTDRLIKILTNCKDWTVDKLERYGNNHDDAYEGYTFNFYNNGNLSVYWTGIRVYGTWVASGDGNNITVTIDVPSLPYCNNDWVLHEISKYSETKIDLRVDGNDRLRYNNYCK